MGKTRSMNRKKNYDATSSKNTIKTCDKGVVAPWSDLNSDALFLVMMQLGVVDFLAFSGVCKPWRSLALSKKNEFIVSRPPMSISISTDGKEKECYLYLEDFEGRKFKTIVPHSADRTCIGVTCGYLILLGENTNDLWLVSLITRHELHFPNVPDEFFCCPGDVRAILVFSPSIFGWVFVVINICTTKLWFSVAGKQEWTHVSSPFYIHDLHAFKGKIYTIHSVLLSDQVRLCEMRLYPEPKLVLLETKILPKPNFRLPGFVSCGENLYVINQVSKHPYKIHELDFDEMKLVSRKKTGHEYAFFLRDWMYHPVIMQESWVDLNSHYGRYFVTDQCGKGKFFHASMWYFFHDFLMLMSYISDNLLACLS